ncbi:putative component of NuA3 histone acetyltransferase complex [Trachipleistophora hominis]|uniref:Putative component of NuA3 histone acetyltransferase complex n=1 Tax=Trachipleistophora hominis TaxID=72359 RepID=L7JW93_TRAHO|nr:putative component of NuA3 histone acetyltransferase complex [Trachipleistophora hominis]
MKTNNFPFVHVVIDNFLTEEEFTKIDEAYKNIKFYEKYTDLYHFFQSEELVGLEGLSFFKNKIYRAIKQLEEHDNFQNNLLCEKSTSNNAQGLLSNESKYWFNIFASYYDTGHYLLCHDDLIEDRKYAFSFYLNDFTSGELILFNEKANEEVERIDVKKNRIVIFEVSEKSFHEVNLCTQSGRKAFTGWYNINMKIERASKTFEKKKNIAKFEYVDICDEIAGDCMLMEVGDYDFEWKSKELIGPFTEQRVYLLEMQEVLVPIISNLKFIECDFYEFNANNYILVKEREQGDYYDMFVMKYIDKEIEGKEFITYIDKNGNAVFSLKFENESLYLVKRNGLNFFVPRTNYSFYLAHFVFTKQ